MSCKQSLLGFTVPWSSQKLANDFPPELVLQSHLNQDRPEQGVEQHSEADGTVAKTAGLVWSKHHALHGCSRGKPCPKNSTQESL